MTSARQVSIRIAGRDEAPAQTQAILARVVASLPASFRLATGEEPADVVTIDGQNPGWPGVATSALSLKPLALVIVLPCSCAPAAVSAFAAAARQSPCHVWLSEPLASNPALSQFSEHHPEAGFGLLSVNTWSQSVSGSMKDALLVQLRVLRAIGFTPVTFTRVDRGIDQLAGMGVAYRDREPIPLAALVTRTRAASSALRIEGNGPEHAFTIHLGSSAAAAPAEITITTAGGTLMLPSIYEDAHRAAWRRVHAAILANATGGTAALDEFAADLEVARRALDSADREG